MVTLQVAKVTVQAQHKLRVAKVTAQGAGTNPKLRVANVVGRGVAPLLILPIPDQVAEGYAATTVSLPSGSTIPPAAVFAWRQISGPVVTFVDNGTNITFSAPTVMAGATLLFGVTPQQGSQTYTEVTAKVNVYPHLFWSAVGGVWVPLSRKAAA